MNVIASKLNWLEKGFRWFFFNSDSGDSKKRQVTDEYTNINLMLVDAKAVNIANGITTSPPTLNTGQDLEETVQEFVTAVRKGVLSDIPLVSIGQCSDILCNSANIKGLATAPPTFGPTDGARSAQLTWLLYLATACVMLTCIFGA